MKQGFIKLHRTMLDWEWYDDPNTMRLFIHCLLRANHKDNNWRGTLIKRGTFLTSLDTLSTETKLSVSQIRTAIKKLESTNEIASLSQARSRVITIVNYEQYQGNDKLSDKLVASSSQADDKLVATNKNDKKEKKDNNEKKKDTVDYSKMLMSVNEIEEVKRIKQKNGGNKKISEITQRMVNGLAKEFKLARDKGLTNDDILTEWENRGWKSFKAEWIKESSTNNNNSEFDGFSQITQKNIKNLQGDW